MRHEQIENAVKMCGEIILNELREAGINCWVAGGSLRDYFLGLEVSTDYDLFFPDYVEYEKATAYFIGKECPIKWESDNGMKIVYKGETFDLVKKFFKSPLDTIAAFDFTVCMIAVDNHMVYFGDTTLIDLSNKRLVINKIPYPTSTMSRAFRYCRKGFSIGSEEIGKLAEAIRCAAKSDIDEFLNTRRRYAESEYVSFWPYCK